MVINLDIKANDSLKESLSALMDDQASELEIRRVLKAIDEPSELSDELRKQWANHQLIGSAIRNETPAVPYTDISQSIRQAVEQEPAYKIPSSSQNSWFGKLGRMAIAASAAGLVVMVSQLSGLNGDVATDTLANNTSVPVASSDNFEPVSLPAGFRAPDVSARTVSAHRSLQPSEPPLVKRAQRVAVIKQAPSPEIQAYIQQIMQLHAKNSSANTGRGVLSYARVPANEVAEKASAE